MDVPVSLRRWFVFHFVADIVFAVPLLLVPAAFLRTLGWAEVDPVTARMVGAALAGIGIESYFCRNDGIETFRSMLRLKCIWSGAAVVGLALSIAQGAPRLAWAVLVIFLAFGALWNTYRLKLRLPAADANPPIPPARG
jgi:hypothetical protein